MNVLTLPKKQMASGLRSSIQMRPEKKKKKKKKRMRTYKIKGFIFIYENHCYRNGQLLKKFSCLNEFESMFRESIDDSAKNFIFYFILDIFFFLVQATLPIDLCSLHYRIIDIQVNLADYYCCNDFDFHWIFCSYGRTHFIKYQYSYYI